MPYRPAALTLGTAKITLERGTFVLRYMSHGNFSIGERTYSTRAAAVEFCRDRDLRIV